MAIGPGTKDGPNGDAWKGIALAAWVDERVFGPVSQRTGQR
jgi:hypothetical protein